MKPIRMLSWNVNGIRAVLKKGFMEWLETESPDILCLQETKASPEQLPPQLTSPSGYHAYYASALRKGYSGVSLWTKNRPEQVIAGMNIPRFDEEGRVIAADFGNFLLYSVYFPNGKASPQRLRYKMDFYQAFQAHVLEETARGKAVIICGDVNTAHKEIDLARPKENEKTSGFLPVERAWIDGFLESGFVDTFRMFHEEDGQYTWWDYKTRARERNIGWRIDYFYVSSAAEKRIRSAFILQQVEGSDHCPIGIEFDAS